MTPQRKETDIIYKTRFSIIITRYAFLILFIQMASAMNLPSDVLQREHIHDSYIAKHIIGIIVYHLRPSFCGFRELC
uniref:Zinc finger CCCH domain-containing protein 1-like n=1 Tax=Rhizophora mucronata TaxID=61149 RepID=A0A2P2JEW1_RHIMU